MTTVVTAHSPHIAAAPAPLSDQGLARGAVGLAAVSLAVFGFLYSLAGVGLGQALFPAAANGSIIERGGEIAGSTLVAQPFADARYFGPRPSAAGYAPMALAGSNQARTHPDLRRRIEETRAAVARRDGVDPAAVPGDLLTQSGSGIDPHIGPQAAAIQIDRVVRARGLARGVVEGLVARHTEPAQFGLLGRPRVNVLELNLALDALPAPVADHPISEHPISEHPISEHPISERPVSERPVSERPSSEHPPGELARASEPG